MKKGFTLLEMLVVVGIIALLAGATIAGYARVLKSGEHARAHELVIHAATALTALFENDGVWPDRIREAANAPKGGGKLLDENVAYCIRNNFSVSVDASTEKAVGYDRFGVVTPWAQTVIKRLGTKASLGSHVGGTSTISDHILHFAVDLDGDGIIENVSIGGQGEGTSTDSISVRATAIVWCCDRDGRIVSYSQGAKKDGIYSWDYGKTRAVK